MPVINKTILGLDPGLADTGFGIIIKTGNQIKFVEAGSIKTAKNKDFSTRLEEIYASINSLLKKYNPDLVAIEKLFFAKNVKTALDVAQARGVALLAAKQSKAELLEFTPLQIKQAICANGQASKQQVGLMVKTVLNLKSVPKPDDAADALAIAICASFFNKRLA